MLVDQIRAAMPPQESFEDVINRLNERMMDRARDNFGHILIDATDFVGFYFYQDELIRYYESQGLKVTRLDGELLVAWKL